MKSRAMHMDMSPAELSLYACFCILLLTSGSKRFKQRVSASSPFLVKPARLERAERLPLRPLRQRS
jgi:hypothetical protein